MTGQPAAPRGPRPYASAGLVSFLATAVLLLGVGAAIAGVAYAINGATQAGARVEVAVELKDGPRTPETVVLDEPDLPGDEKAGGFSVEAHTTRTFVLNAWNSTIPEQVLNRGDEAVLGLSALAIAVLLRPLLLPIALGRPFQRGNAARIAWIAGVVLLGGILAGVLPDLATLLVLDRLNQRGAGSPFVSVIDVDHLVSLLAATPFLLTVAEAFRRGEHLADDVEGLV